MFARDSGHAEGERARGFGRARRAAFLARLKRGLSRRLWRTAPCCDSLRCFEEAMTSRGLERKGRVPEAVAVGSIVDRCGAFDGGFSPVCSCSAERWKRVCGAFLEGKTLPPVELYKVGRILRRGRQPPGFGGALPGAAAVDAIVAEFA